MSATLGVGGHEVLRSSQVPVQQSALLVIDAQDSFKARPAWERRSNPDYEKNTAALIEAYREAGLPVIFFLHTDDDEHFRAGSKYVRLMDFIEPRADEPVFVKTTRNCFTSTGLGALLLEKGVRRIVITGIQTEQCCETTTRIAADLGFAADFVTEATLTFPIPNLDVPGEELGVEEIVCRTEFALRGRFAAITSVARLQRELRA